MDEEEDRLGDSAVAWNATASADGDGAYVLPDYVCCVVTEGVWTYFAAALLIIVLFAIATLKYCKKYLAKPR